MHALQTNMHALQTNMHARGRRLQCARTANKHVLSIVRALQTNVF